ncbi:hypothetical protein D3273_23645 [Lichenibacterium minor]|uniref:DUF1311 domain-containing protein n=1 Tax=Lichenibacterium minor TaxID=2316528 RepID=A0A4Q2U3H2_9HYPH|nr:hypothetical protein [Lichenibacterium minor]RYC29481.1 hypothetical protein D3273_23645 [Lichenibacterium minor]
MRPSLVLLALLSTAAPVVATPALAQLVLPGAVAPTPEGAPGAAAPAAKPAAKPKPHRRPGDAAGLPAPAPAAPALAKVLPAASLAGQTLYRDGRGSEITFETRDKALVVSHLVLAGKADDGSECRVDVADLPLPVRDEGQPGGMARIGIPVPACPISFDVLDGAALETGDRAACAFAATHCRVDPTGLWGPPAASLTPERDKAIERQRTQAEAAVRAGYKRLMSTTKLRSALMGYAHEQAQFSSSREEMCRGYAGEVKHGFCATRVTEARAAALRVKADIGQAEKDARKKKRGAKPG